MTPPRKKPGRTPEPMDLPTRSSHYTRQTHSGRATPAQRRRMKHKENRATAKLVRIELAKVQRLRGAAKASAQKKLDRLKKMFINGGNK